MLKLPISIYRLHPLQLALGHDRHGRAMRTGWAREPQSIDDWDEAASNFRVETSFENRIAWNYDNAYYDDIINDFRKVSLAADVYDTGIARADRALSSEEPAEAEQDMQEDETESEAFQSVEQGAVDEDLEATIPSDKDLEAAMAAMDKRFDAVMGVSG